MVDGSINITVYIDCEHCDATFDLMEIYRLKEDGWIFDLLFPRDANWSDGCKNFSHEYLTEFNEEFRCPECGQVLEIKKIFWLW